MISWRNWGGYSKYGNERTVKNGRVYSSKKEARRGQDLLLLQAAGEIENLQEQVDIPLHVNGIRIGIYRADYIYKRKGSERTVVEDVKGARTPLWKWKWKHAQAEYPEHEFITS